MVNGTETAELRSKMFYCHRKHCWTWRSAQLCVWETRPAEQYIEEIKNKRPFQHIYICTHIHTHMYTYFHKWLFSLNFKFLSLSRWALSRAGAHQTFNSAPYMSSSQTGSVDWTPVLPTCLPIVAILLPWPDPCGPQSQETPAWSVRPRPGWARHWGVVLPHTESKLGKGGAEGQVYSHRWPQPAGQWELLFSQFFTCSKCPPWLQPWHHTNSPFTTWWHTAQTLAHWWHLENGQRCRVVRHIGLTSKCSLDFELYIVSNRLLTLPFTVSGGSKLYVMVLSYTCHRASPCCSWAVCSCCNWHAEWWMSGSDRWWRCKCSAWWPRWTRSTARNAAASQCRTCTSAPEIGSTLLLEHAEMNKIFVSLEDMQITKTLTSIII